MCITFAYASFWKTFAKQEIFICIINWLHLHLHVHAGANPCIASIKNSHMHLSERHLHHKKFSVAPSYGCIHICIFYKDFCTRHSKNKHFHHMHIHSHLHRQEGHLHNKNKFFHLHHHMAAFMFAYPIRIFASALLGA